MKRKDSLPDSSASSKIQKMDNPDSLLLRSVAKRGSVAFDSAKEALELGAGINAANKNGRSVISVAAASGASFEVVKFLLERKANPQIPDKEGHNALYHAASSNYSSFQVISLILSQMNKEDLNIDTANLITQVKNEKTLHLLLTNLKFTLESHGNFLHQALTNSYFPSVIATNLIDKHGYSLDTKDSNGYTPWQSFLVKPRHGQEFSLDTFNEVLLKYPFNASIVAPNGLDALNLLAMYLRNCYQILCSEEGDSNIASKLVKHFIERGAQVNNDTQVNPLHYVIKISDNSTQPPPIIPLVKTFFALADNGVKIPNNILSIYINQYLDILQKSYVPLDYCDTHCRFIKDLAAKYSDQLDPAFFDEKTNSPLSTLRNIVELISYTYQSLKRCHPSKEQYIKLLIQKNNVVPSFFIPYEILKSIDSTPIKFETVFNLLFNEKHLLSPLYKFWDGDAFIPPSREYIAAIPQMLNVYKFPQFIIAEAKRLQDIKFQMNSLHQSASSQVTIEEIGNKAMEEGATSTFAHLPLSPQQDTNEENLDVTMNGSDSNVLDSHL
ncbi:MAG: ankyrin repeat domain-containing protein [Pseudomonadota bacterium]